MSENTFNQTPCFVELLGHNKLAARVSESFGGLLRLDLPAVGSEPGITQFINPSSIYRITVVSEDTLNGLARAFKAKPLLAWEIAELAKPSIAAPIAKMGDEYDPEYEG